MLSTRACSSKLDSSERLVFELRILPDESDENGPDEVQLLLALLLQLEEDVLLLEEEVRCAFIVFLQEGDGGPPSWWNWPRAGWCAGWSIQRREEERGGGGLRQLLLAKADVRMR